MKREKKYKKKKIGKEIDNALICFALSHAAMVEHCVSAPLPCHSLHPVTPFTPATSLLTPLYDPLYPIHPLTP